MTWTRPGAAGGKDIDDHANAARGDLGVDETQVSPHHWHEMNSANMVLESVDVGCISISTE